MSAPPDLDDVRAAAQRIAPYARRTPVLSSAALDERAGCRLLLKCENLQRVGAFKFRGACNAVMRLGDDEARRGVVTHSSGNHAQALALAARLRGIPARIVMPSNASLVKRRAVEGYGGEVTECEPTETARHETADRLVESTGGVLIPPVNHPDIIAGQGTAALELLEETGPLDALVAPVGGGGLVSGTAIAATGTTPAPRIVAAEPAGADDAARSLAAGRLIPQEDPRTICDGLLTSLAPLTWEVIRARVERVVTVDDEAIVAAMRLVLERMKMLIEPSAAVAVAAALAGAFRRAGPPARVGVIISGGNVDLDRLPWAPGGPD
ncbi:MAG: pyridoxal-phosphate dependent enzyme [Planctomycetota bacterium]